MDGLTDGWDPDNLRPGTILGRYEIRRLIGQGGMGCVYEAVHRDLKKRVAIKTLLRALASNGDAKERFLREGEAASRIRHPHVVDVTDVGAEGQVIFLVMEFLEGEDLARLIARQGFLSPAQTADIMLPVAAAIATAHEMGVIHRDLKPENIFLARPAFGALHPKVLDFGISKVLGDSRARALTGSAATMGTMNYLPPEQLRAAREADARSDQYGLGTILYESVTGRRAFEEDNFYIVLKKIAEGEFTPPSARRPGIPERLEAVIVRAMSLEPLDRFESVKQLGAALLEHASESTRILWTPFFGLAPPVEAYPAPRSERARVPTMVAPQPQPKEGSSSSPSGTMELPSTRKSVGTTMRNATGERVLPSTFSPGRRSRAPFVVAGVALVAAVAVLIVLRGPGGQGRREDPDQNAAADPPAATHSTTQPPASEGRETPFARPTPESELPGGAGTVNEPRPAGAQTEDATKKGDEPTADRAARARAHKASLKAARKTGVRGPRVKTPSADEPTEEPERAAPLPNQAPIIPL